MPISPTSAFPSLPVDIFERILTELDGDEPSLSACVRVSRRWREISCVSRFHTVSIHTRKQFDSFCEWLKIPSTQELARHVKVLNLIGRSSELLGFALDSTLFASILRSLLGLDQLFIQDIHIAVYPSAKQDQSLRPISSLTQRTTRRLPVYSQTPWLVVRVLLTLIVPETLVIHNPVYHEHFHHHIVLQPSRVKRLILSADTALRCIFSSRDIFARGALEHVAFSWSDWDEFSLHELYRFGREFGQNIQSMDLQLRVRHLKDRCLNRFGTALALSQSLHTLRLRLQIPPEGITPPHSVLKDIFSEAPRSLSMFTMRFEDLSDHRPRPAGWLDLEELDRPWFRARFPKLQAVTVELESSDLPSRAAAVMNILPKLYKARLLRIVEAQC